MILAGDIGGTKTKLALYSVQDDKVVPTAKKTFSSKDYSSLEAVLREFLAGSTAPITAACFGVAGPVIGGTSKTPNLPWFLDSRELARCLGLDSVTLINDLEATGYSFFMHPETDQIVSVAPFNNLPNQYRISIDGEQKWFAQ